jgi:hypothetical protein
MYIYIYIKRYRTHPAGKKQYLCGVISKRYGTCMHTIRYSSTYKRAQTHIGMHTCRYNNSQEGSVADEYMQWLWMDIDWLRWVTLTGSGGWFSS